MTQRDDIFSENLDDSTPLVDENEPEAEPADEQGEGSPKGMRQTIKAQNAEIAALKEKYESDVGGLKEQAMTNAFTSIGLDPNVGMGKAVAVTFEGEPEQLAEYAEEEFGFVAQREHPFAQQIAQGQAALDAVGQTAGSVAVPNENDELAKAESNKDFARTMQIKSEQLARLMRP